MSDNRIVVGDYVITDEEVKTFISTLPREQQMYKDNPAFVEQIKEKFVEMCLFAMLGEETGVAETEMFEKAMRNARREIIGKIAMDNMFNSIVITEEEMKEYFEANKFQFMKAPQANAKHILVDSEEKAESIKSEIEAGEKSFEDAAKEYSSCPSKQKGGDLGTFGRGQMVKEFDETVFTGELNKILGPVKTQFGYHLIVINSRTEGETPTFEEAKPQIKKAYMNDKRMKIYYDKVAELKSKYM